MEKFFALNSKRYPAFDSMGNLLEDTHRKKSIEELNRENCNKRGDELRAMIKEGKIVLPVDENYPIGKEVWILEYGDIPTKTKIRRKGLMVRYPDDNTTGEMPWVEWYYEVKGNRQEYFSDRLFETRKDAERAKAQDILETFYKRFSDIVERNKFTKEDFPQLEKMTNLKLVNYPSLK